MQFDCSDKYCWVQSSVQYSAPVECITKLSAIQCACRVHYEVRGDELQPLECLCCPLLPLPLLYSAHCTVMYFAALQCTVIEFTVIHCNTMSCNLVLCIALQRISLPECCSAMPLACRCLSFRIPQVSCICILYIIYFLCFVCVFRICILYTSHVACSCLSVPLQLCPHRHVYCTCISICISV